MSGQRSIQVSDLLILCRCTHTPNFIIQYRTYDQICAQTGRSIELLLTRQDTHKIEMWVSCTLSKYYSKCIIVAKHQVNFPVYENVSNVCRVC